MPNIQKFTIAPFSEGLDKELEPWLLPNQAFVEMKNAFIRRGVIEKRPGYIQLATGGEGGAAETQSRLVNVGGSFTGLPIMGIYNYITNTATRKLCAIDTRTFNLYNTTTNTFDFVSHLSGTTYSGSNSDFWSFSNYSLLETSPSNVFQRILVFTNGVDPLQFFDGTNVDDLDNGTGFVDPPASIGGTLNTCKLVFYFGDRLCCLNTKQGGIEYPQRLLYSGTVGSATSLDFSNARAGVIDAPTDDEIMGADFLNNSLIVFFKEGVWSLKITQDRFFPFRWERLDVSGVARCDARFSTSSYFGEITASGKLGLVSTDGNRVYRTDNKIPYFTRDEITPEHFKYCYAIDSEKNRQRWLSYVSPDNSADTADNILVNSVEDNSWSIYTIPMHCFGNFHEVNYSLTWDELDDPWDSNGNTWDSYTSFKDSLSVIGGSVDGYVFKMDNEDNDDQTLITGISKADPAVITVANHRLSTGDVIKIYDVSGMTEINNLQSKVTVINTTSFQLNEIDSTSFTTYTSGGFFEKAIPFDIKTKPLNPWIEQDSKAVLHWVDFRVDSSENTTCSIQFFSDERKDPYIVTNQSSNTITLDFSDDSNRPNKWFRVYVNSVATSHQIRIFQEAVDQKLRIHAIRLAMSQAGTLESE